MLENGIKTLLMNFGKIGNQSYIPPGFEKENAAKAHYSAKDGYEILNKL